MLKLKCSTFSFISENDIYWTDGQHGTVGMATIMEDNIFRRNQRFVENVVGVQGLVAVDTDAHIRTLVFY